MLGFVLVLVCLLAPESASAATRFLSPTGLDSGGCTSAFSACRTFDYAYRQAAPGDVVDVAGGSYPGQVIPTVASKTAPAVEFRPASGAQVTLGGLDIRGNHVTVRDIATGFIDVDAGNGGATTVSDVTVINGSGPGIWVQTARDVLFKGGSYGPQYNHAVVMISGNPPSYDMTFDGVDFHDAIITDPAAHLECLWAGGVQNFTVRNSTFRNCAIMDIFFTTFLGPDPKNVLVENNVLETPKAYGGGDAYFALNIANHVSRAENFTIRNNTFASDITIQPTNVSNVKLVGNVGPITSCKGGVSYSYNVFSAASCSATDKQVATVMSQFVNPAGHDWRLKSGAAAIDSANPNDYPLTDHDGMARVGAPDAGAYEFGGTQVTDTEPPSAPGNLAATGSLGQTGLTWSAATDNVGVARYNVHRSTSAGFTPSPANRVAQVTGTSHTDAPLAAGQYHYRVVAEDAAGNLSQPSLEATATVTADTTAPSVSIGAPAGGASVAGVVALAATASDNVGVAGVQFQVDGANLGAEDTTAPYATDWDTRSISPGQYTLTAVARDAAGNRRTSAGVVVTVETAPEPPSGLVAAYGFEEGSGVTVVDQSGNQNSGTISGAARSTAGRHGSALSFDGANDWVTVADSASLDLTPAMTLEAWVRPTAAGTTWRTVLVKEQGSQLAYALYSNTDTGRPSGHVFVGSDLDVRGPAGLPLSTWSHLAATYDGGTLRLYVNGVQVASRAVTGPIATSTGPLRIGGNAIWPEWFTGLIDEVRVYGRALSAGEIQADMAAPVAPALPPAPDVEPPTAPANLVAASGAEEVRLTWSAATDNVDVARYNVHRSTTAGFTPSAANRVAQVTATSHTDAPLAAGQYHYRVVAEDAADNSSQPSPEVGASALPELLPPSVSITKPTAGALVSRTVLLAATAQDNRAVAEVRFEVDGAPVGAEDTAAPYELTWDSRGVANGTHVVTAVARDAAGNATRSAPVAFSVRNRRKKVEGNEEPRLSVRRRGGSLYARVSEPAALAITIDRLGHRRARRVKATRRTLRRLRARLRLASFGLGPGPHRLTVRAVDAEGNASRPVRFRVSLRRRAA